MSFRTFSIIISLFIIQGCKNFGFVAPVNSKTQCEHTQHGIDPKDTYLILHNDVQVNSKDDSRFTTLQKGVYYPAMHWKKCRHVSYAGINELNIKAKNKFSNFFEKGNDPGGIQIEIDNPDKVHLIWYYRRGTGFLGFVPENGDEIDFEIVYPEEG